MHISSSYAKILGEKLFRTWKIPRSGSKGKNGEREKKRLNDGENNGQARHGARKHAWRTQAAWAKRQLISCQQNKQCCAQISYISISLKASYTMGNFTTINRHCQTCQSFFSSKNNKNLLKERYKILKHQKAEQNLLICF